MGDGIPIQPPELDQPLKTNQLRVSRKRRSGRIRRISIGWGIQRQYLPQALFRLGKKVNELVGGGPEIAYAPTRGQGNRMQQNSSQAGKSHRGRDRWLMVLRARGQWQV